MSYTPYYDTKWQSGEEGNTPITPAALNWMETGIADAHTTADKALNTANNALPKAGGKLTGALTLTEGVHYGTSLPSAGTKGRIFFKVVG
jgi:hypothetical protein